MDLQREVWGEADLEVEPATMFVVAAHTGGEVLGAFDGDRLVGYARRAYPRLGERAVVRQVGTPRTYERFTFRPVPLRRGDIAAHHAYAIHRSGPNRSGCRSGAIALTYRSSAYRTWPPR